MREIGLMKSQFLFISMHISYAYNLHIKFQGFNYVFCVIIIDLINGRRLFPLSVLLINLLLILFLP